MDRREFSAYKHLKREQNIYLLFDGSLLQHSFLIKNLFLNEEWIFLKNKKNVVSNMKLQVREKNIK